MSYITFRSLGTSADLGSQVQQYASMYAIAKETGKDIVFPESSMKLGWSIKLSKLLNLELDIRPDRFFDNFVNITPTDGLLVDPKVFELDHNTNYNFDNLFHLYHYWYPKYKDGVFNIKWNQDNEAAAIDIFNTLKVTGKELVSIHVRRGDYLKHDHFCKLDTTYYEEALQRFIPEIEKYHFLIFSNDIDWCKNNLIEGEMVTFIEPGIDSVDMIIMSMCDHNITANSSFSWWASFRNRNENKQVICPKNYIRSYSPFRFMNGNWYPETWQAINNDDK